MTSEAICPTCDVPEVSHKRCPHCRAKVCGWHKSERGGWFVRRHQATLCAWGGNHWMRCQDVDVEQTTENVNDATRVLVSHGMCEAHAPTMEAAQ